MSEDAVGGAEQVLYRIDHGLTQAGHFSVVIACTGSKANGKLIPTGRIEGAINDATKLGIYPLYRQVIHQSIKEHTPDVIHFHGVDCLAYLPLTQCPILITLHCPNSFYPQDLFEIKRSNVFMHCVSHSQQATFANAIGLLPPILNGVPIPEEIPFYPKKDYALTIGRICPEKNVHVAIEAAKKADFSLLIAGTTFRYESHETYFKSAVLPNLDQRRRFIGPIGGNFKWQIYSKARCTLIPSIAPETSSLVAMESLACGTPVIAFPSGALPEIIEHGKTGYLVSDSTQMAAAIKWATEIDPAVCRRVAMERFSLEQMTSRYISLYGKLAKQGKNSAPQ